MAVLELNTLSGYQVDEEEMQKLMKGRDGIRKVEVEDKDTRVNIYFNEVRWHCQKVTLVLSIIQNKSKYFDDFLQLPTDGLMSGYLFFS
jgi:uncharacterized membrane protein